MKSTFFAVCKMCYVWMTYPISVDRVQIINSFLTKLKICHHYKKYCEMWNILRDLAFLTKTFWPFFCQIMATARLVFTNIKQKDIERSETNEVQCSEVHWQSDGESTFALPCIFVILIPSNRAILMKNWIQFPLSHPWSIHGIFDI